MDSSIIFVQEKFLIYEMAFIHHAFVFMAKLNKFAITSGAGGCKVRPDLSKQRSLSGTPSPSHSRSASASSDLASMVRSSSEGNLPDPSEIVERLKQGEVYGVLQNCCVCELTKWHVCPDKIQIKVFVVVMELALTLGH